MTSQLYSLDLNRRLEVVQMMSGLCFSSDRLRMEFSFCRPLDEGRILLVVPTKDVRRGWLPIDIVVYDSSIGLKATVDKARIEEAIPGKSFIESGKALVDSLKQGLIEVQENPNSFKVYAGDSKCFEVSVTEITISDILKTQTDAFIKVQERTADAEDQLKLTQPILKSALGATDLTETEKQQIAHKRKVSSLVHAGTRATKVVKKGLQ